MKSQHLLPKGAIAVVSGAMIVSPRARLAKRISAFFLGGIVLSFAHPIPLTPAHSAIAAEASIVGQSAPRVIAVGEGVRGELSDGSMKLADGAAYDCYQVRTKPGQALHVALNSKKPAMRLLVLRGSLCPLGSAQFESKPSTQDSPNLEWRFTSPGGNYLLIPRGADPTQRGAYVMGIREDVPAEGASEQGGQDVSPVAEAALQTAERRPLSRSEIMAMQVEKRRRDLEEARLAEERARQEAAARQARAEAAAAEAAAQRAAWEAEQEEDSGSSSSGGFANMLNAFTSTLGSELQKQNEARARQQAMLDGIAARARAAEAARAAQEARERAQQAEQQQRAAQMRAQQLADARASAQQQQAARAAADLAARRQAEANRAATAAASTQQRQQQLAQNLVRDPVRSQAPATRATVVPSTGSTARVEPARRAAPSGPPPSIDTSPPPGFSGWRSIGGQDGVDVSYAIRVDSDEIRVAWQCVNRTPDKKACSVGSGSNKSYRCIKGSVEVGQTGALGERSSVRPYARYVFPTDWACRGLGATDVRASAAISVEDES